MQWHNIIKHVDKPDTLASISCDLLSEPLDSDGADLGKGLEECVGKENLINVNSSLSGGGTASGDIKPAPCCCDMGSSSENRAKECDDASFVWEAGKTLGAGPRRDEGEILRRIVALEARDRVGRVQLKE
ncbi:hypothetical protein Ancab_030197 [Ancistrocladus abbreviatus]